MAAITDEDRRSFVTSNASSDLQYVLQESDVSLRNQYEICQHYRNLKVFAAMADAKAELRQALKDDFRIDHAADVASRAEVARIITAWEMARELASKEQRAAGGKQGLGHAKDLAAFRASSNAEGGGNGAGETPRVRSSQ